MGVLLTRPGWKCADLIGDGETVEDVGDLLDLCVGLPVSPEIVLMFRLAANGRRQLDGAAAEHFRRRSTGARAKGSGGRDDQGDAAW